MTEDGYQDSAALMSAVKNIARAKIASDIAKGEAPPDVSTLLVMARRDRLLARVFRDEHDESWLLKGGGALLARIPSGRATRDIDIAFARPDIGRAADEFETLIAYPMNDGLEFRVIKSIELPIPTQLGTEGRRLTVACQGIEGKSFNPITIDLVTEQTPFGRPERRSPANRLPLRATIPAPDYLLYPLPDQIADKLSGIVTRFHDDTPSTRVKDLVDLVLYVQNESTELAPLRAAIARRREQGTLIGSSLVVPDGWEHEYERQAVSVGIKPPVCYVDRAVRFLETFTQTALATNRVAEDLVWRDGRWARESVQSLDAMSPGLSLGSRLPFIDRQSPRPGL